ncbi:MAG: hypothetical protein ABIS27_07200 [Longimicrobiales bacterium]
MIAKRYGKNIESVNPDFSSVAMTEMAFRKDNEWSVPADDFESGYERTGEHRLTASGDGDVQTDVETGVLNSVLKDLRAIEAAAEAGDILLIENQSGVDYPRLHSTQRTIVVGFENRLHFTYNVDPPLHIGVYRARK